MKRSENRKANQLRKVKIQKNFTKYAEGSVLISCGNTKVICTASIEDYIPRWLKDTGQGWVTAEYGMLPRSTHDRMSREAKKGKQSGRTQEISRLIGRALRASIDLELLGERQITIDCDVIQADGGTRCASITGGYVALALAVKKLLKKKEKGLRLIKADLQKEMMKQRRIKSQCVRCEQDCLAAHQDKFCCLFFS